MNDCQIVEQDLSPQDFNAINDIVHKALRDIYIEECMGGSLEIFVSAKNEEE